MNKLQSKLKEQQFSSLSQKRGRLSAICLPTTTDNAAVATINKPCKSEVGDFDDGVVADKAIACSEVAVNKLRRLEIFHP